MLDTVILWAPDSTYSQTVINNAKDYVAGTEDKVMQEIVQEQLRHGKLTLLKGPNLCNCLRKYSEHSTGKGCEIILSHSHALAHTKLNSTELLSKVLELGFDLFGSKFLVRVV